MPLTEVDLVNQTNATANNATNIIIVHTIDFEPLISFVSEYKWGILLVAIGIVLLLRIDLVALLIAVVQSKVGKSKKKKKEYKDSESDLFPDRGSDRKGDVIDVEYEVSENERGNINRK